MKIQITNPRITILGNKMIQGIEGTKEQMQRQIEKALLNKSIMCEKIEVVR